MKAEQIIASLLTLSIASASCTKYQEVREANYPDQTVYMPAAVEGNSVGGVYRINTVANAGQSYRYIADVEGKRLNIPLAAYRSGVDTRGSVDVTISFNEDTVNRFIAANRLPAGTELLTPDRFTLPSSVNIPDREGIGEFTLSVDLDFLLADITKKYAAGVTVSSTEKLTGSASTAVIFIDPAFLVPQANFTTSIDAATRTVSFSNSSLNSNAWLWDFGDGTPTSNQRALSHTFANPGTYTVTLVASGALGEFNKSTFTSEIVVP